MICPFAGQSWALVSARLVASLPTPHTYLALPSCGSCLVPAHASTLCPVFLDCVLSLTTRSDLLLPSFAVYRYERSGTMHGLFRVRGFTQASSLLYHVQYTLSCLLWLPVNS